MVGGRCEGIDIGRRSPQAVDQTVGQNVIDRIDEADVAACATDKKQVETAVEIQHQLNGYDATTIVELQQFGVQDELNRWTLEIPVDGETTAPSVVAVVGGPCDI